MQRFGSRVVVRAVALVSIGVLAYVASSLATTTQARAQVTPGDYWLYQPQQATPVGRAWCNVDHTAEYWAYVSSEYQFADYSNIPANRWHLEAEHVASAGYANFAQFKAAVLALPQMTGKTIIFQCHSVAEESVEN